MQRRMVSGIMLTLLLISMLTLAFNVQPIWAETLSETLPVVYVDPPVSVANPGEYFTVNVAIAGVTDLKSWGFRLGFVRGLLEIANENITEGPFLKQGGTTAFIGKAYSNYIDVGCMLMVTPGVSGNGTLATATFKVLGTGNATLDLYRVSLIDSNNQAIEDWNNKDSPDDGYFYTTLPVASYSYTPHPTDYPGHPIVNETITFNATESFDPDDPYDSTPGGIVSYRWDFNDGNITTVSDPLITHVYNESGSYKVVLNVTDDDGESYSVDRPIIGTTVPVQLHDIAVINVTVTPAEVSLGGAFTINITVLNQGSDTETLNVTAYANMYPIETKLFDYYTYGPPPLFIPQHHTSLESGKNATTTVLWNTAGVPEGDYTISVDAFLVKFIGGKWQSVPDLERKEDMFDNEWFYGNVNITAGVRHDLAITELKVSPTSLEIDEWTGIRATIKNEGTVTEQFNATLTIEYGSEQSTLKLPDWQNQTINAGTTVTLEHLWLKGTNTTREGDYNITVNIVLVNATTLDFLQPYNQTVPDDDPTENTRSVLETLRMRPVADFTYSPATPVIEEVVTFDATDSYAPGIPGGIIEQYAWDFGDGNITATSTPIVSHVYSTIDTYDVTLTVTDNEGLNNTKFAYVKVSPKHPVASFTYSPPKPWVNDPVAFNASDSYDPDGTIVSYEWDFGDGTTGTGEIAAHVYSTAGSFTVTLKVIDNDGLTDTIATFVIVRPPPTRVYVYPSTSSAMSGETFAVDVKVADVERLHSWQVNMSFNPNVLSFTDVTEGDFLKKGGRETTGLKCLDQVTDGWALFSWSIFGMFSESGSGTLATVEFQVLKEGESELKLEITPIWNDKNMDGVVDVYIHDESYVKAMGFDKDWDSWRVVWEIEKSELIFPSMLIRMNPHPVPPGGTELELISFAATDGFFTSIVSPPVAQATINIDPDTLNLKSKGKWITAYIELPEDYNAREIDLSTVKLNGEISAALHPTEIRDYNNNGILDLMVKFDRQDLIAILSEGETTLTITGEVAGTSFRGTDTIRVVD